MSDTPVSSRLDGPWEHPVQAGRHVVAELLDATGDAGHAHMPTTSRTGSSGAIDDFNLQGPAAPTPDID
jgi:hypothetical protein